MRIAIKKTKVYKFSELSASAQQNAIGKFRENNLDDDWYDSVYEDAMTIGALMGIDIDKIYFSGFSLQGDGACFEGNYHYQKGGTKAIKDYAPLDTKLHIIAESLQALQSKNFYRLTATIKHSGYYYHSGCTDIDVSNGDNWANDETEKELKDILRSFMNWIYHKLEEDYTYLQSDEVIKESIEADEYEFTEDGKFYA